MLPVDPSHSISQANDLLRLSAESSPTSQSYAQAVEHVGSEHPKPMVMMGPTASATDVPTTTDLFLKGSRDGSPP